jgi:hypothetical protein
VAAREPDPLDQLFAAPLADFVKTRDRLAAELRKQGDKTRAAEVKALTKPTPAAWAVNQAVRSSPEALRQLLKASDRMASLQLRAGADPDSRRRFDEAAADHKGVMGQLVGNAGRALRDLGHAVTAVTLEKVTNNIKWAALDPDQRPFLTEGRLYKDLAPQGFGAFGLASPAGEDEDEEATIDLSRPRAETAPGSPPARARSATPGAGRVVPFRSESAKETTPPDTKTLRAGLREAEKRVKEAERELQQRSATARQAQAVLADLERKVSAARKTLETAEEERTRAQTTLAEEESRRQAASDALDGATRAMIRPAIRADTKKSTGPGKRGS